MSVEKGAILVCPFVEPGWIPVLDRLAGVVTETGGLLSHAAVICREYGIPAVLGVSAATRRIPDGKMVRIHGDRGHVEIVGLIGSDVRTSVVRRERRGGEVARVREHPPRTLSLFGERHESFSCPTASQVVPGNTIPQLWRRFHEHRVIRLT